VQGTSHIAAGVPCQDAHVCRVLPSRELVMVIADGAGSAERSDEGARAAALTAADGLAAAIEAGSCATEAGRVAAVRAAAEAARRAIEDRARAAGRPLRDYAATLTCVAAGDDWLVSGQLGDGLAVAESDGRLALAARPQRGEYANEAYFLTMPGALDYLEVSVCREPVHAVAASTDGLLRLALQLPGYEPYAPFFKPLFGFVGKAARTARIEEQLVRFLDGGRVRARTDDDKTLALAVRVPHGWPQDGALPALLALPEPGLASALSVDEAS
jgi:hypothetical protein